MNSPLLHSTSPRELDPDARQDAPCAASNEVLMRQADATRAQYFDNVRKNIAAAHGEVVES